MTRQVASVLLEAIIIGIMNAILFWSLQQMNLNINPLWLLIICGAMIHIVFEYTGANEWWCKSTYK